MLYLGVLVPGVDQTKISSWSNWATAPSVMVMLDITFTYSLRGPKFPLRYPELIDVANPTIEEVGR